MAVYDGQAAVLETGLLLVAEADPQLFQSPLTPVAVDGLLEVVFFPSLPLLQSFQLPLSPLLGLVVVAGLDGSHSPQALVEVVVTFGLDGSQSAHVVDDFLGVVDGLLGSHSPHALVVVAGSAGLPQFSHSFEALLYGQLV